MQDSIDSKAAMAAIADMLRQLEQDLESPNAVTAKERPKLERQLLKVKQTLARLDPAGAGAPYVPLLPSSTQKKLLPK